MIRKLILGLAVGGLMTGGLMAAAPAFAASDVSNTPSLSNKATGSVAASIASSQASTIISTAATGGFTAGTGGFSAGGTGGFSGGSGGGFSPSGGGSGGFAPAGQGGSIMNSRDSGRAGGAGDKKFGAWMQGAYSSVENSQAGLQFDGNVYNLVGGLDYLATDRVMLGVAFGYERLDLNMTFNRGTLEADGFSITPYIGVALNNTWSIDASAGYSWLNFDSTSNGNTVRGSYDATRWMVNANLNGNFGMGRWRLLPKFSVLYLEQEGDAYRDSTGANVEGYTSKLGRLSAGGRIGYAFDSVMPYVRITGEYDFEKDAAVAIGNGTFSHNDKMGAQLGLGFDFYRSSSFSGNVEAAYLSAGRTDMDVWTASVRLRTTF